ncbi:MAG: hypothetical protein PHS59_07905 [Paludibacter sp.]|nr:hypothetical protein [Paludibacter sp.]
MFKKLNNFIFLHRAKKIINTSERERRFVNYNNAKSVLVLFESDFSEKNPEVRKIVYKLQQDRKKVSCWGFVEKKVVITSILPEFRILNHKETNFFQVPKTTFLNELENQQFDLLIDLTLKPILPLQYIALYANASCKTGIKNFQLPLYDFVLDIENLITKNEELETSEIQLDETYLFEQIIFYLKSIQTND